MVFQTNCITHEVSNKVLSHTNSHIHSFPVLKGNKVSSPISQGVTSTIEFSFPQLISTIINTPLTKTQQSSFIFKTFEEDAINNFKVIAKAKGLQHAIAEQQNSSISLDSELRPPSLLEPLFSCHPF